MSEWQEIETAPTTGRREMFVVRAFNVSPVTGYPHHYTSDAYGVWRGEDGEFVRWPHKFAPTHWVPLPAPPQERT